MYQIKGYPDYYITKCGRVFSTKRKAVKELIPRLLGSETSKSLSVDLHQKKRFTLKVHQLVAVNFLQHEASGMNRIVDHINGDRLNNHLSNLQIISQRENTTKDKSADLLPVGVDYRKGKFRARIYFKSIQEHIGLFSTPEQASQAYQNRLDEINKEGAK